MARREACTRSTRSIPAGDVLISAEEEEVKVAKTADLNSLQTSVRRMRIERSS